MKKFLFLLAAVACVVFTNCSKDDSLNNSEPELTLDGYDEPYIKWGVTKSEIRKAVPYKLLVDRADGLMYDGVGMMVIGYIYLTGEENSLYASVAMVKSCYAKEMAEFLWTKYIPVGEKDGEFFAINKSQDMGVVLEVYSESIISVMYFPVDLSGISLSSIDTDSLSSDVYELYDSLVRELEF